MVLPSLLPFFQGSYRVHRRWTRLPADWRWLFCQLKRDIGLHYSRFIQDRRSFRAWRFRGFRGSNFYSVEWHVCRICELWISNISTMNRKQRTTRLPLLRLQSSRSFGRTESHWSFWFQTFPQVPSVSQLSWCSIKTHCLRATRRMISRKYVLSGHVARSHRSQDRSLLWSPHIINRKIWDRFALAYLVVLLILLHPPS